MKFLLIFISALSLSPAWLGAYAGSNAAPTWRERQMIEQQRRESNWKKWMEGRQMNIQNPSFREIEDYMRAGIPWNEAKELYRQSHGIPRPGFSMGHPSAPLNSELWSLYNENVELKWMQKAKRLREDNDRMRRGLLRGNTNIDSSFNSSADMEYLRGTPNAPSWMRD